MSEPWAQSLPTTLPQLRAVRLAVEAAVDGSGDSSALADAATRLRKLEHRWVEHLPFLAWDSARTLAILLEHAADLPADVRDALAALVHGEVMPEAADAALERNVKVRGLLTEALGERGARRPTDSLLGAAAEHLSERLRRHPDRPSREPLPEPRPTGRDRRVPGVFANRSTLSDALDESFPLSPLDDHMIHQTPDPIRIMWTSDLQAYERFWTVCHDAAGEVLVAIGGSVYPSLDLAEAYAIVNLCGDHRAVRAGRPLGGDRSDMRVGPIRPTVVQGLRQWRYELEPNEWGITFDLSFHDTTRQVFREPLTSPSRVYPGRQRHVTTGFESFGVVEGWVDVDGERIELTSGSCSGTRDRHWGIGRGVGGPQFSLGHDIATGSSGNAFVAFADFGLWGDRVFYPRGDPRPGAGRIRHVARRVRFEPDTHVFLEAEVDYHLSSGEQRTLHFRRSGFQTAYLRCGFYGGTPDGRHFQGAHAESHLLEGDRHDVTDPAVRLHLAGLDEHQCEVTCDGETVMGIFQPIDPAAYEACARGDRGWAFLD